MQLIHYSFNGPTKMAVSFGHRTASEDEIADAITATISLHRFLDEQYILDHLCGPMGRVMP